jgi:hypothetical protein
MGNTGSIVTQMTINGGIGRILEGGGEQLSLVTINGVKALKNISGSDVSLGSLKFTMKVAPTTFNTHLQVSFTVLDSSGNEIHTLTFRNDAIFNFKLSPSGYTYLIDYGVASSFSIPLRPNEYLSIRDETGGDISDLQFHSTYRYK